MGKADLSYDTVRHVSMLGVLMSHSVGEMKSELRWTMSDDCIPSSSTRDAMNEYCTFVGIASERVG